MRVALVFLLVALCSPGAGLAQGVGKEFSKRAVEKPAAPAAPPAPADVKAPPPDAATTASGLASKVLQRGTGDRHPGPTDLVTIHYTAWTGDGRTLDSTVGRGQPSALPMKTLAPGLAEGLQLMVVGERRRLWLPPSLTSAMGTRPVGPLVFDMELLAIEPSPEVPPDDVMAPPADATRTGSGLAYRVLRSGPAGGPHPAPANRVRVHYTGWMTDGTMFDSSFTRGELATFRLEEVIKGWTEGLQLMSPGDKFRFWIPSRLAYNNEEGRPRGMLVFDVELLAIER